MSHREYNVHHRKPRSIGGNSKRHNLSWVEVKKHEAWHLLFSNMSAGDIVRQINNVWLDPQYEFVLRVRQTGDMSCQHNQKTNTNIARNATVG